MSPRRRGIYHKGHRTPYHVENSLRGIRNAARRGYAWIDLDLQITKDGVVVNCHWPRPLLRDGFRDPQRKISRFAKVSNLTWAEVSRLRARGGYRINTLDAALAECGRRGIGAMVEPKGDPRFKSALRWQAIKAMADKHGARIAGYTLRANAGALPYMNGAGVSAHRLKH